VIKQNQQAVGVFHEAFKMMEEWTQILSDIYGINTMKDFTFKKVLTSAFRRIVGNGQANHIIATFNHRALRNIIQLRTSAAAEEEIRIAFCKLFTMLSARYPAVYADAVCKDDIAGPLFAVEFKHEKV
jgi:thymidylate synthase ThyX